MKRILLGILCGLVTLNIAAQEEFKPSGKPTAKVFTNILYNLDENQAAFELQRAYLGYNYNLSENFSTNLTFDVGSPEVDINDSLTVSTSFDYTAYLKIAALTYKKEKLQIDMGMVGLLQVKYQEQYWKHRYIYKSLQDESKMGTTADLGAIISYKYTDFLSADFTVRNGEGYKKLENDNAFRSAVGITLTPKPEGLIIRGFYDYIEKQEAQFVIAHFVGYRNDKLSLGAEYNIELNSNDKKDNTLMGFSVYSSYNITDKIEVFARYDNIASNRLEAEEEDWNIEEDGNIFIGGIQFSPHKNVQLAFDYQGFLPADKNENLANLLYLHLQFSY